MMGWIGLIIGVGVSLATGFLLTAALPAEPRRTWKLLAPLFAVLVGVALHSVAYMLWAMTFRGWSAGWMLTDVLMLCAAGGVYWVSRERWGRSALAIDPTDSSRFGRSRAARWLTCAAWIALGAALWCVVAALVIQCMKEPYGGWDARANWNYKARMLYLAPPDLPAVFSFPFPHPDYPLMLPLTVARLWRYIGGDWLLVPQAVAVGSTLLAAITVAVGVTVLRGALVGAVGGLVVTSSVYFTSQGASQYADSLVSLYTLASLLAAVLWVERPEPDAASGEAGVRGRGNTWLIWAGLMAGAAAWTKNEGLAFLIILFICLLPWMIAHLAARRMRDAMILAGGLCGGAALFVAMIIWLKAELAQQGVVMFRHMGVTEVVARAADLGRIEHLQRGLRASITTIVDWPTIWLVFAAGVLSIGWGRARRYRAAGLVAAVIALQLIVDVLVYLLTSNQLIWQINTSMPRVLIQLWPEFVLFLCLLLPGRGEDKIWPQMNADER